MKLADKLVSLARNEIGVEEVDGSNCGVRVDQYKSATNLPPHESWPWCAAFVCWLVREAVRTDGPYTFARPTTAGAWDFENWSKKQDNSTHTLRNPGNDIKAGDIVIFKFSHIGIAVSDAYSTGVVDTVEGNSQAGTTSRDGGGVFEHTRKLSLIKTRIRFTV
jgi:hypothetical protein